jgi:carbonic anhydrase/acetyltransferase-like protein (isoleucine patch superfamily)
MLKRWGLYLIALPWLVLQLTGDVVAMGTTILLSGVLRITLMLMGGAVSDRLSSRTVMLGANSVITDTDFHRLEATRRLEAGVAAPVVIEDNVWIGANVLIAPGARVGEGAVVGMGSVVSDFSEVGVWCVVGEGAVVKNKTVIPDGKIAVGVPAKPVADARRSTAPSGRRSRSSTTTSRSAGTARA